MSITNANLQNSKTMKQKNLDFLFFFLRAFYIVYNLQTNKKLTFGKKNQKLMEPIIIIFTVINLIKEIHS